MRGMRKIIFTVVLIFAAIFVIIQYSEVEAIAKTIRGGDWRFLSIAFLLQVVWLFNIAVMYKVIFRGAGIDERIEKLVLMASASNFVNIVAPTAGMSGMAVFISEARRRGYSPGRVTVAGVLFVLFDYAGFLSILAVGIVVLIRRNTLNIPEIIAALLLLVTAISISYLMFLGLQSSQRLGQALLKGTRFINRLLHPMIHREYLSEHRPIEFAQEASDGLKSLAQRPVFIITPLILALTGKLILMLTLGLVFLSFDLVPSPGTLVAGFSLGYLFTIVSPTPAGIGFVEGGLALALTSLYVPLSQAIVIALTYRGITFWLPMLFGIYSFRILSQTKGANPAT